MQSMFYMNTGLREAEHQMEGSTATEDNFGVLERSSCYFERCSNQMFTTILGPVKDNARPQSSMQRARA